MVDDGRFIDVHEEVDAIIKTSKKYPTSFKHAITLFKNRFHFFYINVGYRMEMLVYDKEASNKTIGRKPRYFVINQVLPSKA